MAPTPLCGSLITSRRSFLALAWTLTTLLSFFSFGVSVFLGIKITNQYNSMLTDDYAEWYRDYYNKRNNNANNENDWERNADWNGDRRRKHRGLKRYRQIEWLEERFLNSNDNNNQREGDQEGDRQHSNDHAELDEDFFESLATTNSRGLVFAGVYTTVLGIALSLYGSTVVVGFMSLKGEYIPPCFSFRNMSVMQDHQNEDRNDEDSITGPRKLWGEKIHRGVFLGSIVIFSNLMILCAVIFGELQVHDNYNNYDEQKHHNLFSYRIEKISAVFAITCIVLAFVYILFAVIYTTCGGLSDDDNDDTIMGGVNRHYEMSSSNSGRGSRRSSRRRHMPNSMDKQEPLVGTGVGVGMPGVGITDNEGFITDMVSTSSGSSMGSHPWQCGKQFSGQLS